MAREGKLISPKNFYDGGESRPNAITQKQASHNLEHSMQRSEK
jgi:hypothetical protein